MNSEAKKSESTTDEAAPVEPVVIRFSNEKPSAVGWYFYRKDARYTNPDNWEFVEVYADGGRLWKRTPGGACSAAGVWICRGQFSVNVFNV